MKTIISVALTVVLLGDVFSDNIFVYARNKTIAGQVIVSLFKGMCNFRLFSLEATLARGNRSPIFDQCLQ